VGIWWNLRILVILVFWGVWVDLMRDFGYFGIIRQFLVFWVEFADFVGF